MSSNQNHNYHRIVEIIVYLVSELKQNKTISDIDVGELQKRGYTNSEISTAFSWLADRLEFSEELLFDDEINNTDSHRILHEAERELFTREAWGDLIQYHSLGIMENDHIETIIEKALMMGMKKLDSEQLKSFIATAIFYAGDDDIPGSRLMLNGDDLIN